MRSALVLLILAGCLAAPASAPAQSSPFGPLPPAQQPTPEPTPVEDPADQGKVSRPLLLGIAGVVAIAFLGIGFYISRDARRNLTDHDRRSLQTRGARSAAERRAAEEAKKKARSRTRAQKQARRKQRR